MVSGATPRGRLCGAALLVAVLAAVGPDRLGRGPRLCVISAIIRRPCPACGITRAAAALLRGDFRRAYRFNPRIVPLALVALALVARDLRGVTGGSFPVGAKLDSPNGADAATNCWDR